MSGRDSLVTSGRSRVGDRAMRIATVFLALLLALASSERAFAAGGSEECSSADGRYFVDLFFAPLELLDKRVKRSSAFSRLDKVVIERKLALCREQLDENKWHRVESERYVLKIRPSESADSQDLFLYCERRVDFSPADACSNDTVDIEHDVPTPPYVPVGREGSSAGSR